jgi:hypothetical protein
MSATFDHHALGGQLLQIVDDRVVEQFTWGDNRYSRRIWADHLRRDPAGCLSPRHHLGSAQEGVARQHDGFGAQLAEGRNLSQ